MNNTSEFKKVTVKSPANIAFIKFWGKRDFDLNIPFNNSISMNLSDCFTITSCEFNPKLKKDRVVLEGKLAVGKKKEKIIKFLDLVRGMAGKKMFALVESKNNFPSDAGIAASASAFSALALAASNSIGLKLSEKELSVLARRGSGSASRSVNNGFSEWKAGSSNNTSYSVTIAKPNFWNIRDLVAVVSTDPKKVSSTEGHHLATSSEFFETRQKIVNKRIKHIKKAFMDRDFKKFGELVEEEAIELHIIAMSSKPPVFYWNEGTMEVMYLIRELREKGILCYYTMDAGANVHVICEAKNEIKIKNRLKKLRSVVKVIGNKPAVGTHVI